MNDKMQHEIGIVCVFNHNFGNNLTNYALYCYLKDLGYSVMMIDVPKDTQMTLPKDRNNRLALFMESPYKKEDFPEQVEYKQELASFNEKCSVFIVGSDQLWRSMFISGSGFYTCLDWVNSDKYKMSYGTSFGVGKFENSSSGLRKKINILFHRFQKISVREKFGCDLLQNEFGIDSVQVLDPVLMCERKHFDQLAVKGKTRIPKEKFLGSYILDPSEPKQTAIQEISEKFFQNRKMVIYDAMNHRDGRCEEMSIQGISNAYIEEWLSMIQECDFFITDSFHGVCFALIYQKRFAVLFHDSVRGIERIEDILAYTGLENHLLTEYSKERMESLYLEEIDYNIVKSKIFALKTESQKWLLEALIESKDLSLWKKEINNGYEKYLEQEYVSRHKLFLKKKELMCAELKECESDEKTTVIGWGTGGSFRRNIDKVLKYCNMQYVVDSKPSKWGKKFAKNVICISPEELKRKKGVVVLIMVDSAVSAFQIVENLIYMGISSFEYVDNYIRYIESLD